MKVAIDKNSIDYPRNKKYEYIYVFDDELVKELKNTKLHCVRYDYCDFVDINLSKYNIDCLQTTIDKPLPPKRDYKFAIIIPNYNNDHGQYNGKSYLKNCIESVLNQEYKDFNLIIVDDKSTDTSVETIKSYDDERIHLIQNIRKRYNGGSRNAGIEYALENLEFDYFCFLDSDDWWKNNQVLEKINERLYEHDLLTLGCEQLDANGITSISINEATCYEDIWSLNQNVWCTAWARVIKKDKIHFFCEDTLMEDRVWTYKIADNIAFEKIANMKRVCYVWNRMNTNNSVSIVRDKFWEASAYCHIGNQLQFLEQLKHKEMKPLIEHRIKKCIDDCNKGIYQQS